jgi:hypothetical protein
MNIIDRITAIKSEVTDLENKKLRAEGQFDAVKQTMKDAYGTTDIKEFSNKRKEIEKNLNDLKNKIEDILNKAEEELEKVQKV